MTPKAVLAYCTAFEETEAGLKAYLKQQIAFFKEIPDPGTDLIGWLCLKLSCNRSQAKQIFSWGVYKQ